MLNPEDLTGSGKKINPDWRTVNESGILHSLLNGIKELKQEFGLDGENFSAEQAKKWLTFFDEQMVGYVAIAEAESKAGDEALKMLNVHGLVDRIGQIHSFLKMVEDPESGGLPQEKVRKLLPIIIDGAIYEIDQTIKRSQE